MRYVCLCVLFLIFGCTAQDTGQIKNVLLICVDDLRPELKSFGADYIISPNIDGLASRGRAFHRHYVNSPSCGPSRYTLLTGQYGHSSNAALFMRAKKLKADPNALPPSMPEWFKSHGFTTVSVGKVSHHPGGMGGPDWNNPNDLEMPGAWDRHLIPSGKWQHPRGFMHGLAHGEIRVVRNEMAVLQAVEGADDIYPDGSTTDVTLQQLDELTSLDKPFFLATGIIRPHLPFGAPKKYLDMYKGVKIPPIEDNAVPQGQTTWHKSGEFMAYNTFEKDPRKDDEFAQKARLYYAACVTYADAQIGKILDKLKETGADKNTAVVLWGDHGWHLGEQKIWGKHCLFDRALHAPLVISYPGMPQAGSKSTAIVETADIFPTLCELTEIPVPEWKHGKSLKGILQNAAAKSSGIAYAYRKGHASIRNDRYRLILHKNGYVELYDHRSPEKEMKNIAKDKTKIVEEMKAALKARQVVRGNMWD